MFEFHNDTEKNEALDLLERGLAYILGPAFLAAFVYSDFHFGYLVLFVLSFVGVHYLIKYFKSPEPPAPDPSAVAASDPNANLPPL